jgi:DNA-binding NarL/FixJ family response regulator
MKILIVDDSPVMRQTIKSIVAQDGDETSECSDGKAVITAFKAFRPDWVLMDIKMDPVNGIQATRALKAAFPDAHVAIVTNYGDQEFRDEAKMAGAERYFLKDNLPAIRSELIVPKSTTRNQQS